jgi:RND family efflux transporter MFP subunit
MHPAYKSDKPGIAPDCGMELVPFSADEAPVPESAAIDAKTQDLPMGTIRVSPQKQQLIGVKYGMPTFGMSTKAIRAVGKVAPDEKRIVHVHTRVDAWIDKVFVDFTGKSVEENQPLLTLYSPDLLATQEEFLLALKGQDFMKASTLAGAQEQSNSLLAATRRRLELWDLSDAQIEEIRATRRPIPNTTLYSPATGYVMARNAFPKQRVTPDTELYTLIDLRKVWIVADFFEADASQIHLGEPVSFSLSYGPARSFRGKVDYIQPQIDPATRTLKVRIDADNPDLSLKPEMFVEVSLSVGLPQHMTVPSDAVLDSGSKKTIFVDRGNGYLEPRQVETGERMDGRVEILRGLKPDERIVTSGTFLIDSESQLKAAASGMGSMPGMPGMTGSAGTDKFKQRQARVTPRPAPINADQAMKDMPGRK